jgi:hypothetical protein
VKASGRVLPLVSCDAADPLLPGPPFSPPHCASPLPAPRSPQLHAELDEGYRIERFRNELETQETLVGGGYGGPGGGAGASSRLRWLRS